MGVGPEALQFEVYVPRGLYKIPLQPLARNTMTQKGHTAFGWIADILSNKFGPSPQQETLQI